MVGWLVLVAVLAGLVVIDERRCRRRGEWTLFFGDPEDER